MFVVFSLLLGRIPFCEFSTCRIMTSIIYFNYGVCVLNYNLENFQAFNATMFVHKFMVLDVLLENTFNKMDNFEKKKKNM